jgi:hypothetical protein
LNDADVETALDNEDDRDKIIDFSRMNKTLGVNVLSENNGSQNKKNRCQRRRACSLLFGVRAFETQSRVFLMGTPVLT